MPDIYAEIEERISQVLVDLKMRKNASRNKFAEEFCISVKQF